MKIFHEDCSGSFLAWRRGCGILGRILAAAEVIYDFSFCKCLNLNINILPSSPVETYEQRLYLFHLLLFRP